MKSANSPRHCAVEPPDACGFPALVTWIQRLPGAQPVAFEGSSAARAAAFRPAGIVKPSDGSASSAAAAAGWLWPRGGPVVLSVGGVCRPQLKTAVIVVRIATYRRVRVTSPPFRVVLLHCLPGMSSRQLRGLATYRARVDGLMSLHSRFVQLNACSSPLANRGGGRRTSPTCCVAYDG